MPKCHTAPPWLVLVVDNSSGIAGLCTQEIRGQGDVPRLGDGSDVRAPTPRNTVLPLVYPLAVEGLPRPLPQLGSDDGAPAQSFDEVSVDFHRPSIIGRIFRVVKARIIPTTSWRNLGKNRRMAANGSKEYAYECGQRLIWARTAKNFPIRAKFVRAVFGDDDPAQFKRDEDNVRKWEIDGILVPPEFITRLKMLFGIDPNYIYSDDSSAMTTELSVRIRRLEEESDIKTAQ